MIEEKKVAWVTKKFEAPELARQETRDRVLKTNFTCQTAFGSFFQ